MMRNSEQLGRNGGGGGHSAMRAALGVRRKPNDKASPISEEKMIFTSLTQNKITYFCSGR